MDVSEIADRFNQLAPALAPRLLPNGRKAGNVWQFSGIPDHGRSWSAFLYLAGSNIGHWEDRGGCAAGEQRGDLLDLVRLKECGGDMAAAVAWAKRELGIEDAFVPGKREDPREKERRAAEARARAAERAEADAAERAKKAKGARGLFLTGAPIAGTPAEKYLQGRGLETGPSGQWPGSFRFVPDCWCSDSRDKRPALLAAIANPDGQHIGTHRIYLQRHGAQWGKLDVPSPKKVLGNMWGGFIPVNKGRSGKSMRGMPAGEPVYVTEGPEDAVCVRMMKPEARILCAISLANIGAIVLPAHAGPLVIVADRDSSEAAQATLERAIAQQQARGQAVQLVLPPAPHKDVNDWWRALQRADERRRA